MAGRTRTASELNDKDALQNTTREIILFLRDSTGIDLTGHKLSVLNSHPKGALMTVDSDTIEIRVYQDGYRKQYEGSEEGCNLATLYLARYLFYYGVNLKFGETIKVLAQRGDLVSKFDFGAKTDAFSIIFSALYAQRSDVGWQRFMLGYTGALATEAILEVDKVAPGFRGRFSMETETGCAKMAYEKHGSFVSYLSEKFGEWIRIPEDARPSYAQINSNIMAAILSRTRGTAEKELREHIKYLEMAQEEQGSLAKVLREAKTMAASDPNLARNN